MRNTAFLALGLALLIIQSNLFRLVGPLELAGITPSLMLPLIVFMGVHEYSLSRGAALSFVMGYLIDVFAAAPVGLYTFNCVAIFVVSRVAGVRLAAQTVLTKIALAFVFSLLEGTIVIILTAIFGGDPGRPRALAALVLPHAVATALMSPVVFKLAQRVHEATILVPRPEKAGGR
ncbi:MAG: rod shape-determining protein MreD [Deltaproteobacteria bacterium]|jgi:rod shape-determining protein MreD|nr:rod shape-determining protein MreD [Deltaproteobacteria bacterium]MBW2535302.1 rod shape-determining protein MreD [Deltaproteobacteria bacterium]